MNLFEAENKIKNFSDEQLGQEMLQPSGMVPQYMIMSELNRRKTMRQEAGAKPQPNTSIADEMKQGIMQIANQDGPQQQYAEGGLVGYQDGGMTRYLRNRSLSRPPRPPVSIYGKSMFPLLTLMTDDFGGTSERMMKAYENEFMPPDLSAPRPMRDNNSPPPLNDDQAGYPWIPPAATPNAPNPDNFPVDQPPEQRRSLRGWDLLLPGLDAYEAVESGAFQEGWQSGHPEDRPEFGSGLGDVPDYLRALKEGWEGDPGYDPEDRPEFGSFVPDYLKRGASDLAGGLWEGLTLGYGDGLPEWGNAEAGTVEDQNDPTPSPGTDPKATSAGTSHIKRDTGSHKAGAGAERNTDLSGHAVPAGSTVGVGGQVNSMDEFAYADRIKEWLGWEPGNDAYDEYEDKVQEYASQLEEGYTQDKWMALAQLGATMASTPGDFATAWGAGVNTGIDALRESKDQQRENKLAFLGMEGDLVAAREAARRGDIDTAANIYAAALGKVQGDQRLALQEKALALRAARGGGEAEDFRKEIGKAVMGVISDPFSRMQASKAFEKQHGKEPTEQELIMFVQGNAARAYGSVMMGGQGGVDLRQMFAAEGEARASRQQ